MTGHGLPHRGVAALYWLLLYGALWAVIAEGGGWLLGVPFVVAAVVLSLRLSLRPWRLRLRALPGFVGYFLRLMLGGAWDVARRALHRRCPVAPAWVEYPLSADSAHVHLLLSALVGLLPGTLASGIEDGRMQLHVLDRQQPWQADVAELERRLANLLSPLEGGR
ncbi:Na+/H+ antiporter subunit E [Stutzerimonas azotifigens]|uniref:Na+/H+ antiporter subunit E n=1 Tax=Stutzerimonas azotifigens TaxID=291995 RepID=UPI0004184B40|nr:Na+/H+ antiporter subunit E [Stutzerimonas azotifigens]